MIDIDELVRGLATDLIRSQEVDVDVEEFAIAVTIEWIREAGLLAVLRSAKPSALRTWRGRLYLRGAIRERAERDPEPPGERSPGPTSPEKTLAGSRLKRRRETCKPAADRPKNAGQ